MAFNKDKVMDAARKLVEKGQVDKAIKEYLRVVREDPQDVRVWLKIGDLHAKIGQRAEATDTYVKVARFYQDQGFFTKAVAVYKQILKLDPQLVEVHLKLAELYRQLGLMGDAMVHFESVATHFHREGKTKEALATVRQLVDLDPQNVATRIKLAELYSKEGMVDDAVREFGLVCDQLRRQDRPDDFIKVAERLLFHRPEHRELNRELAGLYLQRADPRRALQKLQVCFKADPRDVETLALLAQAFLALEQKGKTVSVYKELARVLDETKQRSKAEEIHRKILAIAPGDPEATAYLAANRPLAPSPVSAPAAPRAPELARPRFNLTEAVPALRPDTTRMTGSMPLLDARALEEQFELPDDEAIEIEPYEDPAPPPARPPVRAATRQPDFAADLDLDEGSPRGAKAPDPDEPTGEILKILTETDVYVKYGLHQKAVEHLRRVFAVDPDNLAAHERLKDVYLFQGREADAIAELLRLVELTARIDPSTAEGHVRDVLALDGANRAALELARRYNLDISLAPDVEVIDGSRDMTIEPDEPVGMTPVEDDFDGLEYVDRGRRHEGYDQVDPTVYDPAGAGGGAPAMRAGGGAGLELRSPDTTRQVAVAEVERLVARSRAVSEPGGVARGSPLPFRTPTASSPSITDPSAMGDAIDASLEDPGDDIDQGVANAFRDPAGNTAVGMAPHLPMLGDDVEDLPFDAAAAREFDAYIAPGSQDATIDGERGAYAPASFDAPTRMAPMVTSAAGYAATFAATSEESGVFGEERTAYVEGNTLAAEHLAADGTDGGGVPAMTEPTRSLEEELEEADDYASAGRFDETMAILRSLQARFPRHPLVAARVRDLRQQLGQDSPAAGGTQTVDVDDLEEVMPEDLDGDDDVAAAMSRQPASRAVGRKRPAVALAHSIEDSDVDTHFDLGLAYKEMGLYDDAIKAFEKVFASPSREVQSRMMVGLCNRERGELVEAVHQFKAGLHASSINERERQTLLYEIGTTYEALGDTSEAVYYFEMVVKRDPTFLDAVSRLDRLRRR